MRRREEETTQGRVPRAASPRDGRLDQRGDEQARPSACERRARPPPPTAKATQESFLAKRQRRWNRTGGSPTCLTHLFVFKNLQVLSAHTISSVSLSLSCSLSCSLLSTTKRMHTPRSLGKRDARRLWLFGVGAPSNNPSHRRSGYRRFRKSSKRILDRQAAARGALQRQPLRFHCFHTAAAAANFDHATVASLETLSAFGHRQDCRR